MNTGSRDEMKLLADVERIARALERIADAVEFLAGTEPIGAERAQKLAEGAIDHLRGSAR